MKLRLDIFGFAGSLATSVKGYIAARSGRRSRVSPLVAERERFEREVRDQFLKLKEKGLSIPVFTL